MRQYVNECDFFFISVSLSVECLVKANRLLKKCMQVADNYFGLQFGQCPLKSESIDSAKTHEL